MYKQCKLYQMPTLWCAWMLLGFGLVAVMGCGKEDSSPDVSSIEVDLAFIRFDSLLFDLESSKNVEDFRNIQSKHPVFTDLYVHRILGFPQKEDSLTHKKLVEIANATAIQALRDSIYDQFADMRDVKSNFRDAFRYYQYYFPEFTVPDVYFCFTEFAVGTFLFETEDGKDALGLSLDMFLGSSFPYSLIAPNKTTFSEYLIRTFTPEHMIRKSLEVLIADKTDGIKDTRLLDYMVDRGRTLYLIKKLVPSMPDSILFEYTAEQVEWCRENELAMWAHILDKELLYERKMRLINSMVSPAPSTMGMPPESPGRTADFLGYQLIDQYVEHTESTLSDLLTITEAQDILRASRYKGQNIE